MRQNHSEQVHIASRLFVQEHCRIHYPYMLQNHISLQTGFQHVLPENMQEAVNSFVSKATKGNVPTLIDEEAKNFPVILANALYFEMRFQNVFYNTNPALFYAADGSTKEVPTMTGKQTGHYIQTSSFVYGDMPFESSHFSFFVVVPQGEHTLCDVMANLTFSKLIKNAPEKQAMIFRIPTINIDFSANLKDVLTKSGVEKLFSEQADLSHMTSSKINVRDIVHKAKFELDENGVKAVAATEPVFVFYKGPSTPDLQIKANRPFLFGVT
ncbi:hypothetical protein L596_026364 [Steinernema carpocapsae]|uniref:Serpin domain-containing protein n=1 Tax=Steinernema carpocapsae TaxID=34508 RepID=A0A4U5M165_STECR|nr:hypothetical protein L596_026364 [Steinernema carpocapsae]